MVETIIAHQKNYMNKLVEKLKKEYVNPNLMFDPLYFETHHPCELDLSLCSTPNTVKGTVDWGDPREQDRGCKKWGRKAGEIEREVDILYNMLQQKNVEDVKANSEGERKRELKLR